ncbi:MAG: right-handed parallel beta-helix repeat-containing protein [Butyrivibrio sp.]|nr:right-handed parallel beta-helix repeat-containing protein [Butyrivibrio sp.]
MDIYVSSNAFLSGDGSKEHPFKSISEASIIARPGDNILVFPGIYREKIIPRNSGLEDRRISYKSMVKGAAVISATEVVKNFTKVQGYVYETHISNQIYGDYNPFNEKLSGDYLNEYAFGHTAQVFMNGRVLTEVKNKNDCFNDDPYYIWDKEGSICKWFAEVNSSETVLYCNFGGRNPNEETIEVSVRSSCFFPDKKGINYITVSGFKMFGAASKWAPPTAFQEAAIGHLWAKGWIMEDLEISSSKCCGISLGKYFQEKNNNKWTSKWMKYGSQTRTECLMQAYKDGWNKNEIGSHIIRRCEIHDCGQAGIAGNLGCIFSVIEDNHIYNINLDKSISGSGIAGINLQSPIDTIIRRNHIHNCIRGMWLELGLQGTRITQNVLHDNLPVKGIECRTEFEFGEDIFIEMSHGPVIVDRNVFLSPVSARISAQGIAFVHNLFAGAISYVGKGTDNHTRKIPSPAISVYHFPHSTDIAGFSTILHGDVRFYNNIFVQMPLKSDIPDIFNKRNIYESDFKAGTFVYNEFPTATEYFGRLGPQNVILNGTDIYYDHLPVFMSGNAYFNGAQKWEKEINSFSNTSDTIGISLVITEEAVTLKSNLYEYLQDDICRLVDTGILGEAFESEQRFEDNEGRDILFNKDFFDNPRAQSPVCGPFEDKSGEIILWNFKKREEYNNDPVIQEDNFKSFRNDFENITDFEERESDNKIRHINTNITITHLENVTFPFDGKLFMVRDIFVRGDDAFIRDLSTNILIHLDCRYGIYKKMDKWEVSSIQEIDATEDLNMEGLGRTICTLLCILNKSMTHDPEDVCRSINEKVNESIEPKGITMRLNPGYLKFIRGKKFITLEDVIYRINQAEVQFTSEPVRSSEDNGT